MEILNGIIDTYAAFFDWGMWVEVLSDPVSWGLIGTLIILEGLLSADNALVLAVMVKHLPEKQRKKLCFTGFLVLMSSALSQLGSVFSSLNCGGSRH